MYLNKKKIRIASHIIYKATKISYKFYKLLKNSVFLIK